MEGWPKREDSDASAQFNLMRNLGGAIGIALVDTIVQHEARVFTPITSYPDFRREMRMRPALSVCPLPCSTAMRWGL